jgi:hypothetical protein
MFQIFKWSVHSEVRRNGRVRAADTFHLIFLANRVAEVRVWSVQLVRKGVHKSTGTLVTPRHLS